MTPIQLVTISKGNNLPEGYGKHHETLLKIKSFEYSKSISETEKHY